jgi:hypothetical protein
MTYPLPLQVHVIRHPAIDAEWRPIAERISRFCVVHGLK